MFYFSWSFEGDHSKIVGSTMPVSSFQKTNNLTFLDKSKFLNSKSYPFLLTFFCWELRDQVIFCPNCWWWLIYYSLTSYMSFPLMPLNLSFFNLNSVTNSLLLNSMLIWNSTTQRLSSSLKSWAISLWKWWSISRLKSFIGDRQYAHYLLFCKSSLVQYWQKWWPQEITQGGFIIFIQIAQNGCTFYLIESWVISFL